VNTQNFAIKDQTILSDSFFIQLHECIFKRHISKATSIFLDGHLNDIGNVSV